MDLLSLALLLLAAGWLLKASEQRRRVALLAKHLQGYQIERHMETLAQGYLNALRAPNDRHLWERLRPIEDALCAQFERFAAEFARNDPAAPRVSTLPLWVPFALSVLPSASFDMRAALDLHARGICGAVRSDPELAPRDRAFTISAELFLMQHTCHWFCKSRLVASARLLARHKTSYGQVLDSVSRQTRVEYAGLVGR